MCVQAFACSPLKHGYVSLCGQCLDTIRGNKTVVTGEGGASFQASEFCLISTRCQPLSEWHLGTWRWGETPTESTQGQFTLLERIMRVRLAGCHSSVCVNASGACFPQHRELIWVCTAHGQIYGPYTPLCSWFQHVQIYTLHSANVSSRGCPPPDWWRRLWIPRRFL